MTKEKFIKELEGVQESLRRFLLSLCEGDAFTADDIAQDACIKAWLALDGFKGRSKMSTWLFRIAYNTWCDRKYQSRYDNLDSYEALKATDGTTSDDKFEYEELYLAIARLSQNEKAAILLFYMEDKPIKEISTILGYPNGTIKSLLSRGRAKLKIQLQ